MAAKKKNSSKRMSKKKTTATSRSRKAAGKGSKKASSTKAAKKRGRPSSDSGSAANYPRHSVRKALRIPQAIFDQNAGNECTIAQSADYVGVGNHSPYKMEVSSATKYGLLDRSSAGKLKPTDLAAQIIKPQSLGDEISGLQTAVLMAPQISDVYKHYRGENLPDEIFFNNTVSDTYGVPREKLVEFRDLFLESLKEAELLESHGGKTRVLDVTEKHQDGTGKTKTQKTLEKGVSISPEDSCFVMQPFATPIGDYYESIFKPAIKKAGMRSVRADDEI